MATKQNIIQIMAEHKFIAVGYLPVDDSINVFVYKSDIASKKALYAFLIQPDDDELYDIILMLENLL